MGCTPQIGGYNLVRVSECYSTGKISVTWDMTQSRLPIFRLSRRVNGFLLLTPSTTGTSARVAHVGDGFPSEEGTGDRPPSGADSSGRVVRTQCQNAERDAGLFLRAALYEADVGFAPIEPWGIAWAIAHLCPALEPEDRRRLDAIWAFHHTTLMRNLSETLSLHRPLMPTSPGADREPSMLASQVLALRRELGLTQAQLAQKSGIGQSEISRLERGRIVPTILTVDRVASALGARLLVVPDGSTVESPVSLDGTSND